MLLQRAAINACFIQLLPPGSRRREQEEEEEVNEVGAGKIL